MKPGDVIEHPDCRDRYRIEDARGAGYVYEIRLVGTTTFSGSIAGHDYGWWDANRLFADGWRVAGGVAVDPAWRRTVEAAGFKVVDA